MNPVPIARRHLDKAREFLDAAEVSLDLDMFSAATSNAVISGINSKDAICLRLTGRTRTNRNHADAANELKQAGKRAGDLAPTLTRLLKTRSKAQYQSVPVTRPAAVKAIQQATTLFNQAQDIVTS
ncbi:MAG: HEPN domain-containing protein [Actinomycetota bacterium]|nr:HEPN domain-containing protein [Actinomycetota bacterium]